MKAKDLAARLMAEGFAPSPSDDLGARGQNAINLIETLNKLEQDIGVDEEASPAYVAQALYDFAAISANLAEFDRRVIFAGVTEIRLQYGLPPRTASLSRELA